MPTDARQPFARRKLAKLLRTAIRTQAGTTGTLFFVSSVFGSSGYSGTEFDSPKATITQALALCTASKGDIIVCAPDHAETITSAGGITVNKAGVTILGVSNEGNRPTITFTTAAAASFDVTAANVRIEGFNFVCGIDAQTAMFNISAAGFVFRSNRVVFADASAQTTLVILTTAAADRMLIRDNDFLGTADAGTATCIRIVGGSDARIINNRIIGAFTTTLGGIEVNTTAHVRIHIEGNTINNRTAGSTVAAELLAGTTGNVINNRFSILSGTAPLGSAATSLNLVAGNYFKAAAGVAAGTLL